MDTDKQPTEAQQPAETGVPPAVPTPPVVAASHTPKRSKLASLFSTRIIIVGVVALMLIAGLGFYGNRIYARNAKVETPDTDIAQDESPLGTAKSKAQEQKPDTSSGQEVKPQVSSAPPKTTTTPSAPADTPAPAPAPAVNTTNCLPPNPSPYATHYISMTNSQYLQTNGYVNTTKMYAALQFAGLLNTINSKQYVVLAMDDSQWSNFTQAQLDWMNASPANMRSVIGWQVITSCITWNGVNPVKDMTVGTTRSVTTLNGPVTYLHLSSGGYFGNGKVAIWDWFTSNGSVTIAGFVDTSSIP